MSSGQPPPHLAHSGGGPTALITKSWTLVTSVCETTIFRHPFKCVPPRQHRIWPRLAGNSGLIPSSPLQAARTLTGTIAQEMGEVARGSMHFSVLFAMGLVLFAITFAINLAADIVLERQQRKWRR